MMNSPWKDRSALTKVSVVFAAILLVSIGLCGVNLALFSRYGQVAGPELPNGQSERALTLMGTAFLEVWGMAIGAGGLIVIAILAIGSAIYKKMTATKNGD